MLEQVAQRHAQPVDHAHHRDAQRIVVVRQARLGHRHPQARGFVEFAQADVVEVAGQQPLAGFRAGDHVDPVQLAQQVLHQGVDLGRLDDTQRALWRRSHVGFVFQAFHVLPHLDVAQNVGLPLLLQGRPDAARVGQMLAAVGLDGLGDRLPHQLSGGQLQRVAIARALVHRPALLLADEPTGNLDPTTAALVMDLLIAQTREHGAALVLVTHSQAAAARADRVLRLTAQGIRPAQAI